MYFASLNGRPRLGKGARGVRLEEVVVLVLAEVEGAVIAKGEARTRTLRMLSESKARMAKRSLSVDILATFAFGLQMSRERQRTLRGDLESGLGQ